MLHEVASSSSVAHGIKMRQFDHLPALIHRDKKALLALRTDFSWPRFISDNDYLPAHAFQKILNYFQNDLQGEFLIQLAAKQPMSSLGNIGLMLQTSDNLAHLIELISHFVVADQGIIAPFKIKKTAKYVQLYWPLEGNLTANVFSAAMILKCMQQCAGLQSQARLLVAPAKFHAGFNTAFQVRAKRSRELVSVIFTVEQFNKTWNGANKSACQWFKQHVKQDQQQQLLLQQLLNSLFASIDEMEDLPSLDSKQLAMHANLSEFVFNDILAKSNVGLDEVLEQLFRLKAITMLQKNVADIAIADALAMNVEQLQQQFRQWLGLSIQSYRLYQFKFARQSQDSHWLSPDNLPSISQVGTEIIQMINDENYLMQDLVLTISKDPVLTAKLMGLAGSAFYGAMDIKDLNDAVTRVFGTEMVRNLAVAILCNTTFKKIKLPDFDISTYWYRQTLAAELAKNLAESSTQDLGLDGAELYLTSMVKNVGFLYLALNAPEQMAMLLAEEDNQSIATILQRQQAKLDTDQYQVAALLMNHWHLPKPMCNAVEFISEDNPPLQSQFLTACQALADVMAAGQVVEMADIEQQITIILNQDSKKVTQIVANISNKLDELQATCEQLYQ